MSTDNYAIINLSLRRSGFDEGGVWFEYEYDFYKNGNKVNHWWIETTGPIVLDDIRDAMRKMKRIDRSFYCLDCGVHTGETNEYYMVHDKIWLLANPSDYGMLCIGCLEGRIGRELTPTDFTNYPVNYDFGDKSDRLRKRLGYGKQEEVVVP